MEAAGDVGAGDDLEHRVVVPEHPRAEGLADVGVEVHPHGHDRTLVRHLPGQSHDRRPESGRRSCEVPVRAEAERQPMTVMFAACGPFAPCWVSYSTLAFSSSER